MTKTLVAYLSDHPISLTVSEPYTFYIQSRAKSNATMHNG